MLTNKTKQNKNINAQRDTDFVPATDRSQRLASVMTPVERLTVASYPCTLAAANDLLRTSKKGYLPIVDESGALRALTTRTDLLKNRDYPNASKDPASKARVRRRASDCGVGDGRRRCAARPRRGSRDAPGRSGGLALSASAGSPVCTRLSVDGSARLRPRAACRHASSAARAASTARSRGGSCSPSRHASPPHDRHRRGRCCSSARRSPRTTMARASA